MNKTGGNSGQRPNRSILSRTLIVATMCGIVAFLLLGMQLFKVMIIQHDYYEKLAVSNQTRETTVNATRGTIYDSKGAVLAISASAENIFISPYEINKYDEDINLIANFLSDLLGVDRESIIEKSKDVEYWYKTIATAQPSEITDQVREFKKANNIVGVHLETTSKRYYPNENLACHIIGFTGTDGDGLEGIERLYDSYLQGTDGSIIRLKAEDGSNMPLSNYEYYFDAQNGCDVTLTIDSTIQFILEKHLDQAIEDYNIQNGGCGIVMNINTGEIYGMASRGDYDLNNYLAVSEETQAKLDLITDEDEYLKALGSAQLEQWRNTAVSNTYEPGSVFKILTMAMALEEGVADLNSHYNCSGSIQVLGRKADDPVKCWRTTGHGTQTLTEAAQHSCNCAFVKIGIDVGAELFYKYCESFGLFDETNIDLMGEGDSIWWPEDVFYDKTNLSQLAAASFGQTFNVTPIQMISAVAAACNGGELLEPFVVKEISNSDGDVVYAKDKTVVRNVLSEETSAKVCAILEQVVGGEGGTGSNAYVTGYRVGGKTGTTTKTTIQVESNIKEYMVSFCGVAPTDDPEVICLIILDNPARGGTYISGGQMAAPVVGNVLSEVLPYLGVAPVYTENEKAYINVQMDYVIGSSVQDAKAQLEKSGFKVRISGNGSTVTGQMPHANASVITGSEVVVYTESETPENTVTVPDLYGMTLSEVRSALSKKDLFVEITGALPTSSSIVVFTQSVKSGDEVKSGSVITVGLIDKSKIGEY